MRRVSVEEMARAPAGTFVAGETFAHFCAHPKLWGMVLWGRPDEQQALQLGQSLVLELAPPAEPHASIVDASRIESGSPGAFGQLERYVAKFGPLLKEWVTRLVIVRSKGLGGAIALGSQHVLPLPYPTATFDDPRAAFTWLGEDATSAPMLEAIFLEASGTIPLVAALRSLLDANLHRAEIASAAKSLGVSERSLQRKLGEAGTRFQLEVIDARVRAAKKMLSDGDAPLTTIAIEVGCASLQHFNTLFRKRTGLLPSAWREKHR